LEEASLEIGQKSLKYCKKGFEQLEEGPLLIGN
jgi:hypothetical protein